MFAVGCGGRLRKLAGQRLRHCVTVADGVRQLNSVSRNALCGTGMELDGKHRLLAIVAFGS